MRLDELFPEFDDSADTDVVKHLRDAALDVLMPFAAHGLPHVSIQQVIDKLKQQRSGLEIDRDVIMTVLDPEEVKIVKNIEGDMIYFSVTDENSRETDQAQAEKDKKHVHNTAQQQAKKSVTSKGPLG